jgi:hypothetical protein
VPEFLNKFILKKKLKNKTPSINDGALLHLVLVINKFCLSRHIEVKE